MHVNNIENLLYCDLNETLEEQNLLESKEILELATSTKTAELIQTPVETAKIMKTLTKMNELQRVAEGEQFTIIPIHNENYNNNSKNILMVDEVNEMSTTKTPVTCINVYNNKNNINENSNNKNNSKEQQETCAVLLVQPKETCQNSNSCSSVKFVTATTTTTSSIANRVPLEIYNTNKICSSSSIENISPQTQNKIHNQCQSASDNKSCTTATAVTTSISFTTTNTNTEHKNNSQQQQQQQENQEIQNIRIQENEREQFTSAYTLRDFAKCLKPSADEDIIYTLNSIQNENQKEKLQIFNFNLNSNSKNNQQFNTNEEICVPSSAIIKKSIENIENTSVKSEVNFNENLQSVNENNLYNKILKPDNGINHTLNNQLQKSNDLKWKSTLNNENLIENQEIVKLKDTQFLEFENLSTPQFSPRTKKKTGLDFGQKNGNEENENNCKSVEYHKNSLENIENFENKLKFDCNEKIYTREEKNNFQPLSELELN